MEKLEAFQQELSLLLSENETENVFTRLFEVYHQTKGDLYDELLVLSSRYKALRDQMMAGIIEPEKANIQVNQINYSLALLIDQIDKDHAIRQYFGLSPAPAPSALVPDAPATGRRRSFFWMGGTLLAALAIVAGLNWYTNAQRKAERIKQARAKTEQLSEPKMLSSPEPETPDEPVPADILPGKIIRGALSGEKDRKIYRFTPEHAALYTFRIRTTRGELQPRLELFDAKRQRLAWKGPSIEGPVSTLQFYLPKAGATYFLSVEGGKSKGEFDLIIKQAE